MNLLAILTIVSAIASLLSLLVLHFVSPEFKPSWRMISEYAMGKHKWLITSFFFLWGLSSLFLSVLLWNIVDTTWAMVGVVLLLLSAAGEIMGGLFDLKHKYHGVSFLLGVPSLPVAALLITYNLVAIEGWEAYRSTLLVSAHSTWISLIVMALAMAIMFSGFKKAGIPMSKDSEPPENVPDGVIALGGYANRILVLCYITWLILVAISGQ